MKKDNLLFKILVSVAYVGVVVVNYLANALPIAGKDTGEISDAYANLFAPAGITFSIWGVIYLLLGIYVVYQFVAKEKDLQSKLSKINIWFLISSLANISWIFAWHYEVMWLTILLMLVLLVSLIKIADIINGQDFLGKSVWGVRWPFSIYFGWITVATIANISVFLVSINWDGFGVAENIWTIVVLIVGAIIGIWRTIKDKNILYALVLVWAYAGILLKHFSESGFGGQYPEIIATLFVCEAAFLVMIVLLVTRSKFLFKEKIV